MIMNNLPRMQVLITTNDQYIEGELLLPENMRFSNSVPDNMLFYILNGGFQFLTLKNCEVKDRKNLAFRPDKSHNFTLTFLALLLCKSLKFFQMILNMMKIFTKRTTTKDLNYHNHNNLVKKIELDANFINTSYLFTFFYVFGKILVSLYWI